MDRKYYSDKILEMLNDEETYSELQTRTHTERLPHKIQLLNEQCFAALICIIIDNMWSH